MGIVKACDPRYGLNAITVSGETYLTIFLHATKLKVNENGTEGAAASMGGMDTACPDPEPTPELEPITFDRPFIYLIQEKTTGSIIFIGTVAEF